jgi:hypothetical protein
MTVPNFASASVTLLDRDDWKVQMSGFIEFDNFHDSKRAFTEAVGNGKVPRANSFDGSNGRYQSSIRNSRLAFSVLPPQAGEWKSKGYLEYDLLGYDPAPSAQTESSFYTNATLRVRHAYMSADNDGWSILAGQYWTLFGWEPTYVLTTVSVPAGPGIVYQRTAQLTGMKTLAFGDNKLQIGASVTRPSQRDSSMPNFDAGVKYAYTALSAGFASPSGDVSAQTASVAVSGTMRQFATPTSNAASPDVNAGMSKVNGSAFAIDAMIPVLPSSDNKETDNTLTFTGEFSSGKGDADAFPSWTGGLPQNPTGTGASSATNLDPGQGSWDSAGAGSFKLIKLQSWNAELQYHLPKSMGFFTLGHAELVASGYDNMAPAVTYDKAKMDFINFFHDFTPQIRGAVEYAKFTTHYIAPVNGKNDEVDDRIGVSAFFRF